MKRVCILLLILLCFATTCFAEKQDEKSQEAWKYCAEIRNFADPTTEHMLLAFNNGNYNEFSREFSQQMKLGLPENKFVEMSTLIKNKFGNYVSLEFISIEIRESYIAAAYKGKFSQGQEPVLIRSVFTQENGKTRVTGFWLTPLKLVGNVGNAGSN